MKKFLHMLIFALFAFAIISPQAHGVTFNYLRTLDGSEGEGSWSLFQSPTGVFVDSSNRLYVTDSGNNRIKIYSQSLDHLTTRGGQQGNLLGSMDVPKNCWVDPRDGKLYVADSFNARVDVYTSYNGIHTETIGRGSGVSYQFQRPNAVAVDADGYIHVTDTMSDRIQVYDTRYLFVKTMKDLEVTGNLVFSKPSGIFIDTDTGMIYVADTGNNRVQVFTSNYSFVERLGWGSGNTAFDHPTNVWVDKLKRIYVADTYNDRIQVFDSNFSFIGSINGFYGNYTITKPEGVAVDSLGRVFVTDTKNNRVLVFQMVDSELESVLTREKIDESISSADSVVVKMSSARSKLNKTISSGCNTSLQAAVYLAEAEDDYSLANNSISEAEKAYTIGQYSLASAHISSANSFIAEANARADEANGVLTAFLFDAGVTIDKLIEANTSLSRVVSLEKTAASLNISVTLPFQVSTAQSNFQTAVTMCSQGNYNGSQTYSNYAIGNTSSALDAMHQQINLALIPKYAQLKLEFDTLQGNITIYDLPIDATPIKIKLELTHTLILDSKYEEALQKMGELQVEIASLSEAVDSYAVDANSSKTILQEQIYLEQDRLDSIKSLAANYSQNIDSKYATALIRQASGNLTAGNLKAANSSLLLAGQEIDVLNMSMLQVIHSIDNASAEITLAENAIDSAKSNSFPVLLQANLAEAEAELVEAKAKLYTSPSEAAALASDARTKAEAENGRLSSQFPLMVLLVLGITAIFAIFALGATGIGAFTFFKIKGRKPKSHQNEEKG